MINFVRSDFGPENNGSDPGQKTGNGAVTQSADKAHDALLKQSEFPSAQEWGGCHLQIYREWSVSRHAYPEHDRIIAKKLKPLVDKIIVYDFAGMP